jgi:hypothetical protein
MSPYGQIKASSPLVLVLLGVFVVWVVGGWLVRTIYWYRKGTWDRQTWHCPTCRQDHWRAGGEWVPECPTCGWQPGSVLSRWLVHSVPLRQLRLTVFRTSTVAVGVVVVLGLVLAGTGGIGAGILQPTDATDGASAAPSDLGGQNLSGGIDPVEVENQVVQRINDHRRANGLDPLERHPEIHEVATAHSQDMHDRNFNGHTNPDGETPKDRLAHIDVCRQNGEVHGSENYAWMDIHERVYPDDSNDVFDTRTTDGLTYAFVDWWKDSPPHRTNQLRPDWEYIGVGVVVEDGTGKVTANFC